MSQEVPRDESEHEDDFADDAEDFDAEGVEEGFEAEGVEEGFDEEGEEGDNFYEDDFSLALNDETLVEENDQVRVSFLV